jgi:hypothetical protein
MSQAASFRSRWREANGESDVINRRSRLIHGYREIK